MFIFADVIALLFDDLMKYRHKPARLSLLPSVINNRGLRTFVPSCLVALPMPALGLLAMM